jgi:hypothetical protein
MISPVKGRSTVDSQFLLKAHYESEDEANLGKGIRKNEVTFESGVKSSTCCTGGGKQKCIIF